MRNQLLIFYLFVGLTVLACFNLFLVLSIKIKGETPFYRLDPKSPNYKKMKAKYQKRASGISLAIAITAPPICIALTLLQLRGILGEHYKDVLNGLLFGPVVIGIVFIVVVSKLKSVINQYTSNTSKK